MIGMDIDKKETKQVLKVEFLKELLKEMANSEEFKDDKDLIENYLIVENNAKISFSWRYWIQSHGVPDKRVEETLTRIINWLASKLSDQ